MRIGVGLGLAGFPFSDARAFWRWVDLCEEGGVDSLWQTDRLVSRRPVLKCMSAMAAIAGRTKRIRFGMNVASVGLRDPRLLARQCATIDMLSGGRLLPRLNRKGIAPPSRNAQPRPSAPNAARSSKAMVAARVKPRSKRTAAGDSDRAEIAVARADDGIGRDAGVEGDEPPPMGDGKRQQVEVRDLVRPDDVPPVHDSGIEQVHIVGPVAVMVRRQRIAQAAGNGARGRLPGYFGWDMTRTHRCGSASRWPSHAGNCRGASTGRVRGADAGPRAKRSAH